MKKDIYCIEADGRMLDVAAKDDLGTVLDAWRSTYKDAEAVPAESRVDTSKPVIHQVRELFEKLGLPYEIWRQGRRVYTPHPADAVPSYSLSVLLFYGSSYRQKMGDFVNNRSRPFPCPEKYRAAGPC